jgi:hypothetical protein
VIEDARGVSDIEAMLDARAAAIDAQDLDDEVSAYIAAEHASWTLADRVGAYVNANVNANARSIGVDARSRVDMHLVGGHQVAGWVRDADEVHVTLATRPDSTTVHAVVHLHSVMWFHGLGRPRGQRASAAETRSRAGLGRSLRDLQESDTGVTCLTGDGRAISGLLAGVHRDHCDLHTLERDIVLPYRAVAAWMVTG